MDKPKRVAVVFVHGQGDQRPMKDVLELANSVWETDPRASGGDQLAPIWSVPTSEADDLPDQRRLVSDTESGVQVDFYQFYWSHLMHGNRFTHLWVWLLDLFAKKPGETPPRLRGVRAAGMAMALFLVVLALAFCLVSISHLLVFNYIGEIQEAIIEQRFNPATDAPPSVSETDWLGWESFLIFWFLLAVGMFVGLGHFRRSKRKRVFYWAIAVLTAGTLFWTAAFFHPRMNIDIGEVFAGELRQLDTLSPALEDFIDESRPAMNTSLWLSIVFQLVLLVVIIGGVLFSLLNNTFLTPVMADSARYFRPSPENIAARHSIRRAGVQLLERLHESKRDYSRIIVVGHSLGSVVAYGMIEQLWGRRSGGNVIAGTAGSSALAAVENAARELEDLPRDKARLVNFRRTQRGLFRHIADRRGDGAMDWRISDFVTLGSPLNYGAFLLAESESEFVAQMRKHRRLSSCPPDGTWENGRWSFCYESVTGAGPHHAALFAAVRWTNVHFTTTSLATGDVVGGPVAPVFGVGVLDVECDPSETKKTFAHNEYWRWPDDSTATSQWYGGRQRAFLQAPRYLRTLRCALNLFDRDDVEDLLQKMSWRED